LNLVQIVCRHCEDVTSDGRLFQVLLQRRGSRRSWKTVSVVQPVLRSMTSAGVVDQESSDRLQYDVKRPTDRPAAQVGAESCKIRR